MRTEEKYYLIDKYLKGELSFDEKKLFDSLMINDEGFKSVFESCKLVEEAVLLSELDNVKAKIAHIHKTSPNKNVNRNNAFYFLGGGFLLFIVIGLFYFFYDSSRNQSNKLSIVGDEDSKTMVYDGSDEKVTIKKLKSIELAESLENDIKKESVEKEMFIDTGVFEEEIDTIIINEEVLVNNNSPKTEAVVIDTTKLKFFDVDTPKMEQPCPVLEEPRVRIINSCKEKPTGEIVFEEYEEVDFSINGGRTFNSKRLFKKLNAGYYTLTVRNKVGCKSSPVEIQIDSYECNFIFNPSNLDSWEIPWSNFLNDEFLELKIFYSRINEVVFSKEIQRNVFTEWNGKGFNNEELIMGSYTYILVGKLTGKIQTGNVTIVK